MNVERYLTYPAQMEDVGGGSVLIRIRGWEGAISEADSRDEALDMARYLVLDLAEAYIQDKEEVPAPLPLQEGDLAVDISYDCALKIALRNAMLKERVRPVELAERMHFTPQRLNQLLTLRKPTKFAAIAQLFSAIGRPLRLSF